MPDKNVTLAAKKDSASVRKSSAEAQVARRPAEPFHPVAALARAMRTPASELSASDILTLQRTAGNRAVAQLLARKMAQEPPSDDRQRRLTLQAKLSVGAADDSYEREADRVAAEVAQTSAPSVPHVQRRPADEKDEEEKIQAKPLASSITPLVQRKQMPEEEDEQGEKAVPVQRRSASSLLSVEPDLERRIERARAGGQALPDDLRQRMEQSFGADFSHVRVHTDSEADSLNRSLESRAFTSGYDLFFKRGEYHSSSSEGEKLIAHELTHVIQQNKAPAAIVSNPKPHGNARAINLSRAGNNLIQRTNGTGTAQATAPAPAPKVYDKDAEDKRLEDIRGYLAGKVRASRLLGGLFKEYEESWGVLRSALTLPLSFRRRETSSFEAATTKLRNAIARLEGLDRIANALEIKHTELKARWEPHKKTAETLDETTVGGKAAWLLSYSADKKQEMKDQLAVVKPIATREQREFYRLNEAKKNLEEIKLSETKEDEKVAVASEIVEARDATRNVTPSNDTEKGHFKTAEDFITDLDTKVDTTMKDILEKAADKKNEYLEVSDGQIDGIKEKWKKNQVVKNVAEARVKAAAKIQHEPTKDAWFTKLGLVKKEDAYNWIEAGVIGGSKVHETLYRDQITASDVVTPAPDALKNQVLGTGVTGYHISLENKTDISRNSHAYRGTGKAAEIIRYADYQQDHPGTALPRRDLVRQLRAKRNACVARVEGSVQNAKDNKGQGMMTKEVHQRLEE